MTGEETERILQTEAEPVFGLSFINMCQRVANLAELRLASLDNNRLVHPLS